jgi:hypothetical protein
MRRFGSSFPSSRRVERSRCVCRFSVYGSRKNDWKVEWSENTLAGVTLGQRAEAWIPLHVATAFADAGRRCLATAMHPEMVTNEACNGLCAVCQTGPQRRAHSGRVPGGSAPITMAHCPSAVRAVRLREASKIGPVAGSALAAISVRGGRILADTDYNPLSRVGAQWAVRASRERRREINPTITGLKSGSRPDRGIGNPGPPVERGPAAARCNVNSNTNLFL